MFFSCTKGTEIPIKEKHGEEASSEIRYYKEIEELKKGLKGDIRVKLKKDPKGEYTWEITGKDAQEVLKTNDILKNRLSKERP